MSERSPERATFLFQLLVPTIHKTRLPQGHLIIAVVKGEDRASVSRIAKTLQRETLRLATPAEILEKTGYPCGGTPSFGYQAIFLIDPRVMEQESLFTGGGSETSLVKITSG